MKCPSLCSLAVASLLATLILPGVSTALPRPVLQESHIQLLADGDPETYWSTPGRSRMETEFVHLDLGAIVAVGRVSMLSRSDDGTHFPRDFEIQVSTDDVRFTTVHGETGFTAAPGTIYSFDINPPASGRYVRILVTGSNPTPDGRFVVEIAEVSVHEAKAHTLTHVGLEATLVEGPIPTSLSPAAANILASAATPASRIEINGYVLLGWVAPGDDLNTGTAAAYEIRYDAVPITEATFARARLVSGVPLPQPAGTPQSHLVLLAPGLYYFAIVAFDEVGNRSPLSNVVRVSIPCYSGCSAVLTDKLTWNPSPDEVTEYRLYIAEASGSYDFRNPTASVLAWERLQWSFAKANLQVGTSYVAVVKAVDAEGNESGPSNEVDFVIVDGVNAITQIERK